MSLNGWRRRPTQSSLKLGKAPTNSTIRKIDSMRPIFVVGCQHSGTSLLTAMLDSHENIHCFPGESYSFLPDVHRKIGFQRLTWLVREAERRGKQRICEKTPAHVRYIDRISMTFQRSRILFVVRDGRDVAYSIYKRTGSIDKGVKKWLNVNQTGLEFYEKHQNIHLLRYEDLIEHPERTLRQVSDFIGEEFDPNMLNFDKVERLWFGVRTVEVPGPEHDLIVSREVDKEAREKIHRQRRNWQINQPLFDGRQRWTELPAHDQEAITRELRPLLVRLGYVVPPLAPPAA